MTRWLGVLICALLLTGCGYHRPGQGESVGEVRAMRVKLFVNQTYEPYLENILTDAVTQRFLRTRRWRLVENPALADAVFSGTVDDYRSDPISFDSNDNVLEFRSQIRASGELRSQESGRVLWKGTLSWSQEYPANSNKEVQEDQESVAINSIAQRLAEEFYYHLTDNF